MEGKLDEVLRRLLQHATGRSRSGRVVVKTVRVARFDVELLDWLLSGLAWDAAKRMIRLAREKLRRKRVRLAAPRNVRVVRIVDTVHLEGDVSAVQVNE